MLHPYIFYAGIQGQLEPIPAVIRQRKGHTLEKSHHEMLWSQSAHKKIANTEEACGCGAGLWQGIGLVLRLFN